MLFSALRTLEDYMRDRVNFVVTNSQWDDNFDEVGPCHRKLELSYSIVKKVRSYIAQYPVLRTAQSALHFTLWLTCSTKHQLNFLWKHPATLQLMCTGCSYKYPPQSITRYSFMQLCELEQCTVKKHAQNLTCEHRIQTWVLSLSHCALHDY